MTNHDTLSYPLRRLTAETAIARAEAPADRLSQRRTCRFFSAEPVPREVIAAAIAAADAIVPDRALNRKPQSQIASGH